MTDHIKKLLQYFIQEQTHKQLRQAPSDPYRFARVYSQEELSDLARSVARLKDMLAEERPVVFPFERIAFMRTVPTVPEIFTEEEFARISSKYYIHEQGKVCNISPLYSLLMDAGLNEKKAEITKALEEFRAQDRQEAVDYEEALLDTIDIILDFSERYRKEALSQGNALVADTLSRIPAQKPQTFLEALQFLRIIHYCLWCSFNYHNTLGRFDQYMYPYYKHDLDAGLLTNESALELIEEFFISLNRDSDLYTGMQQGDNGQSLVLGGLNPDGSESYNELSELCLQASLELRLIDPKINLRVNKNTPLSTYVKGTQLTRQGLGFPQYSNDDIVLEALKQWGYEEQDRYNYVVAACWEFIIPGCGMDIPNLGSLSFPRCINQALQQIEQAETFQDFMALVKAEIFKEAEKLRGSVHDIYMEPAPLLSLMMKNTVEKAQDISMGSKYNNYGFHGTGLSTAADSLASIRRYIYDTKEISKKRMLEALATNFASEKELNNLLRYEAPKMGNDDDYVDSLAVQLLDWYADSMEGYTNDRNGIYRVGTGSAMYYIWQAQNEQATPDGRLKGEAFACNYSPGLFTRLDGPISVIKSFTKPHLVRAANGGPLTIELTDTMFRNEESIQKTAQFVRTFIALGGHQLQINAVNREKLLDAKKHPEKYRNLIVRVWGWSGYFVELDECYQDHIIKRAELTV